MGCEGAANAFSKSKYAITLVVEVTDGTLTIGLKNKGTRGNEWTAAGNFGLWYLGETETDALAAIEEVTDYNAARITTLTELFVPDIEDEKYAETPGFAAAQKATLLENSGVATFDAAKTIGNTMEAIAETKLAYADLFEASTKVYEKWSAFATPDADAAWDEVYAVRDKLAEGEYADAAAAAAATEELFAKYPDYMEVVSYSNVDVVPSEVEAFNYLAISTYRNPSVLIGGNFYDALTEDEVIFAFEYSATAELPKSRFYIGKDADDTQAMDIEIPAAAELTQVYIDLSEFTFGNTNDEIRWRFAVGESDVEVGIRHARMITKAQMKEEGGKPLNGTVGDLNGDNTVDIADAVTVLDLMANNEYNKAADLNNDDVVDIADFVSVLDIMAQQ